jgi:hypothetical protein
LRKLSTSKSKESFTSNLTTTTKKSQETIEKEELSHTCVYNRNYSIPHKPQAQGRLRDYD